MLDTGSMVSTITESFFIQHFQSWGQERLQSCRWLQLRAANHLDIPYVGYLELDVTVLGKVIPKRGILIVKDPPQSLPKPDYPGVLGMNVIGQCFEKLFGQHGLGMFDLPAIKDANSTWHQALQYCHQVHLTPQAEKVGTVRVRGKARVCVPAGTMKLVATTCSQGLFNPRGSVLFQPPENSNLPGGLLLAPAIVKVAQGTVYIPFVNVGTVDIFSPPPH